MIPLCGTDAHEGVPSLSRSRMRLSSAAPTPPAENEGQNAARLSIHPTQPIVLRADRDSLRFGKVIETHMTGDLAMDKPTAALSLEGRRGLSNT
jgi:hypothetical protein